MDWDPLKPYTLSPLAESFTNAGNMRNRSLRIPRKAQVKLPERTGWRHQSEGSFSLEC